MDESIYLLSKQIPIDGMTELNSVETQSVAHSSEDKYDLCFDELLLTPEVSIASMQCPENRNTGRRLCVFCISITHGAIRRASSRRTHKIDENQKWQRRKKDSAVNDSTARALNCSSNGSSRYEQNTQ